MSLVEIRDLQPSDEYFVGTCTHMGESEEIDASARSRLSWLQAMFEKGSRVKVAILNGNQVGFLHIIPIEICPWGPVGRDLSVVPCLVVKKRANHRGVGRSLLKAAEEEARNQGRKGLVALAYYHDFWFMPAPFFERFGFSKVKSREVTAEGEKEYLGREAILWKVFDPSVQAPKFLRPNYQFEPMPGKVVVDLFWNTFCQTSNIEAQRVREVVAEFRGSVVLHEYCVDDREILLRYQIPRGIFINGKEIGWGYEAPKGELREIISQALRNR